MKRFLQLLSIPAVALVLTLSAPIASADNGRVARPDIPEAQKGESCVEDTDVMRRQHMDFLMWHRDETMHRGIRTPKYSLKECIECHVAPKPASGSTGDEGHFCMNCHEYAGVSTDCFQCHTPWPGEQVQPQSRLPSRMHEIKPEATVQLSKTVAEAYEKQTSAVQ